MPKALSFFKRMRDLSKFIESLNVFAGFHNLRKRIRVLLSMIYVEYILASPFFVFTIEYSKYFNCGFVQHYC